VEVKYVEQRRHSRDHGVDVKDDGWQAGESMCAQIAVTC
jgi:hypothetical protein